MIKHTPGPWTVKELGGHPGYPDWTDYAVRCKGTNVHLATVGNVDRYYERNNLANARLIAAAPDLLEAARDALAVAERTSDGSAAWIIALRAAIAAAEQED
jgi:hypothetical protein